MKDKNKNEVRTDTPLSDEELELVKASIASQRVDRSKLPHYDNSLWARFRRYVKNNKLFSAICAVLAVCIVTVLSLCIVFAVNKINENKVNTDDFTIILGDEKYTVEYDKAVRDGIFYIDMMKIAKYTDMTVSGSDTSVKFTAAQNNYLRFENGSNTAVINGSMVDLGGIATVTRETCEIPYEFLNKTLGSENGLKLSLDRETNTLKIKRRMYETDKKDTILPFQSGFYKRKGCAFFLLFLESFCKFKCENYAGKAFIQLIQSEATTAYRGVV